MAFRGGELEDCLPSAVTTSQNRSKPAATTRLNKISRGTGSSRTVTPAGGDIVEPGFKSSHGQESEARLASPVLEGTTSRPGARSSGSSQRQTATATGLRSCFHGSDLPYHQIAKVVWRSSSSPQFPSTSSLTRHDQDPETASKQTGSLFVPPVTGAWNVDKGTGASVDSQVRACPPGNLVGLTAWQGNLTCHLQIKGGLFRRLVCCRMSFQALGASRVRISLIRCAARIVRGAGGLGGHPLPV